jgi:polar amino acid transport system substrate-binding protein/glutamine transport system substrate-binding protein
MSFFAEGLRTVICALSFTAFILELTSWEVHQIMQILKKMLALTLVCVCLIGVLAGCGKKEPQPSASPSPSATGTDDVYGALEGVSLKIGTSGLFGPFTYYDKDGRTLIGFDIDLIYALQEILGFEIEGGAIQAMDYAALTTSVAEGKLDVAAAALCVTDERVKVIDFTKTYQDSGMIVMVNEEAGSGIEGVEDLTGKTIAVEKGTAAHAYVTKNLPDSKYEVHDTITTAYLSLEQQKVDAVIHDRPGIAFYINTTDNTKCKAVGEEFNKDQSPYAIALTKNSPYTALFDAALDILRDNGTLEELENTWCR